MAENEVGKTTDKVEKNDQSDRTLNNTANDSVIGGDRQEHQKIHQEAFKAGHTFETFSDNKDDQSMQAMEEGETLERYQARLAQRQPKAESFGIDFGDGILETAKGKSTKSAIEETVDNTPQDETQAVQNLDFPTTSTVSIDGQSYNTEQLLASNLSPNNPIQSDAIEFKVPNEARTTMEDERPVIADYPGTHPLTDRYAHPFRHQMDDSIAECTKGNPKAWEDAYENFPPLQKYMSMETATNLMKAIVRNELYHYDSDDANQDREAKNGNPHWKETLGQTQISPKGLNEFETGIQDGNKVREPYKQLQVFLKSHGHAGKGHETTALEDPSCSPMIMAAKLSTLVELYEKYNLHHPEEKVEINERSLAYGFNADVYKASNGDFEAITNKPGQAIATILQGKTKVFPPTDPEALRKSIHLKNIEEHLKHYSSD